MGSRKKEGGVDKTLRGFRKQVSVWDRHPRTMKIDFLRNQGNMHWHMRALLEGGGDHGAKNREGMEFDPLSQRKR